MMINLSHRFHHPNDISQLTFKPFLIQALDHTSILIPYVHFKHKKS